MTRFRYTSREVEEIHRLSVPKLFALAKVSIVYQDIRGIDTRLPKTEPSEDIVPL
jgi:hypothetical protein